MYNFLMELNDRQKNYIDKMLKKLSTSSFRSQFHLRKYMIPYIDEKGLDTIEVHARELLIKSLKIYNPSTDGHQTPMKNHPVFIAQHACGCCCRGCLEKWHRIPKSRELNEKEINYLTALVMEWIQREYQNFTK